jgi:ribosomal protein S17E
MKTELIDFYKNNYERFEANKQKVLKILEIVDKDYYYFENLI